MLSVTDSLTQDMSNIKSSIYLHEEDQQKHLRRSNHTPHEKSYCHTTLKFSHDNCPSHTQQDQNRGRPKANKSFRATTRRHGEHGDEKLDDGYEEDEIPD